MHDSVCIARITPWAPDIERRQGRGQDFLSAKGVYSLPSLCVFVCPQLWC